MTLTHWDRTHMDVAKLYAERSHAQRIQVGCIIVKDNRVLSIGINGMPSGWDNSCETKVIHDYGTRSPVYKLVTKPEVLHAETNAIAKIARSSESCEGATLYTTCAPCLHCAKLIYQAGITRVIYGHKYKSNKGLTFLEKCNIIVNTTNEETPDYESL